MPKRLILCDCLGSQTVDSATLQTASGLSCSKVHTHLCGAETAEAARAIEAGDCVIACQQESPLFDELAAEMNAPQPEFVDLRDRAGWSDEGPKAAPKMAALLADSLAPSPPVKTMDVVSEGLCLILGAEEVALHAAEQLSDHLSVTLLLAPDAEAPLARGFDVVRGTLKTAEGALGNFSLRLDALQQLNPGGRGAFTFGSAQDGARSECDILLDLRPAGTTPLFPAHEKREGYLRADPASPGAVAQAILTASHMSGTFEKPLYLSLEPLLCAHSRAGQEGCRNCLDVCPTGAIVSAGEHVDIDPMICAGCGSCAALCPSGAITFEDPTPGHLFSRMRTLSESYTAAGGAAPRLLVHDQSFGIEMVALSARFGRGLPADVIPLDLGRVSGFGHAEMLAALACGFSAVDVLLSPGTERGAIDRELALAQALSGQSGTLRLLEPADPDALDGLLYGVESLPAVATPILPMGSRRQVARLATMALHPDTTTTLPLPADAPYGTVDVDKDACTLCLSCASLCPGGALGDNPDQPQLRFQEDACLQCGLCVTICPENAITLEPRMDLTEAALQQRVLHEEDPFECVECGKPFGVRSTIEKIVAKLEGNHAMFATSDAARMIRMCDDCRVQAQYHSQDNPFAAGERPRVRTTDDYLSKRKDH